MPSSRRWLWGRWTQPGPLADKVEFVLIVSDGEDVSYPVEIVSVEPTIGLGVLKMDADASLSVAKIDPDRVNCSGVGSYCRGACWFVVCLTRAKILAIRQHIEFRAEIAHKFLAIF